MNFFGSQFLLGGELLGELVIDELSTIADSIDTLAGILARIRRRGQLVVAA